MSNTPAIRRRAYFISDRTGITVESMGEALLNQFNAAEFKQRTYPFIDTPDKAHELLAHIAEEVAEDGNGWGRPLIFSSVVIMKCEKLFTLAPRIILIFMIHLSQI